MTSFAARLVQQAERLGAEFAVRDGRLMCRPRGALPPALRTQIASRKAEVLAYLLGATISKCPTFKADGASETSETPDARSSAGFAGAQVGPVTDTASARSREVDDFAPRRSPCYACGGVDFWALVEVGSWVCALCHEPDHSREQVAWTRVRPP